MLSLIRSFKFWKGVGGGRFSCSTFLYCEMQIFQGIFFKNRSTHHKFAKRTQYCRRKLRSMTWGENEEFNLRTSRRNLYVNLPCGRKTVFFSRQREREKKYATKTFFSIEVGPKAKFCFSDEWSRLSTEYLIDKEVQTGSVLVNEMWSGDVGVVYNRVFCFVVTKWRSNVKEVRWTRERDIMSVVHVGL